MSSAVHHVAGIYVVDPRFSDYEMLFADIGISRSQIKCFASGEEALQASGQPAGLPWFINVQLRDMPGIALLKLVRSRLPGCAIFLIGDEYSLDDELTARSAGATAYLCKPPNIAWLSGCKQRNRSAAIRDGPTTCG